MSGELPSTDVTANLDDLRERLTGAIVLPSDGGWDERPPAVEPPADQRPAAVALPAKPGDVAAVVDFARAPACGWRRREPGHNAGPARPLEGAVLLKTARMRGVEIDADGPASPAPRPARCGGT